MVTQPMETQTQGDLPGHWTSCRFASPVHDSAHPGSPFPVTCWEMAAQSFEVSAEVYSAIDSDSGAVSVGQGQIQAPPHMRLGTQVGSDLPYLECPSHALFQSSNDEEAWRLIRPNHWARSSHSCMPSYSYSSPVILPWVELGWHHSWTVTWSCSSSWCRR